MKNYRAIIFDWGNVLYKVDNNNFFKELSKYSCLSFERIRDIYFESGLYEMYESGRMSSELFFDSIKTGCELKISEAEYRDVIKKRFTPMDSNIALLKNLKPKYRLGLLSNTSEWDFEEAICDCKGFELFDSITLSFEVGVMKPNSAIYRESLKKLWTSPENAVFIDDLKENVDGAKELGIEGILYTSLPKLERDLKNIGIDLFP